MTEPSVLDDDTMGDQSSWSTHTNQRPRSTPGTNNTDGTVFNHAVLLKIGIAKQARGKINVYGLVYEFVDALLDHCKDAIVISTNKEHKLTDMSKFPADQKAFTEFFPHETVWTNNPRNKYSGNCMMKLNISATKSMEAIKSGAFLQFLQERDLHLTRHSFSSVRATKMAIMTMRHPAVTNIPKLQEQMRERLDETFTEGMELPQGLTPNTATEIHVRVEKIVHRVLNEDPSIAPSIVTTEAICVYTNAEHANTLANLISTERIFSEHGFGHWIPWSVRHEPELFANKLREHNAFINRVQTFKLEGVTKDMMKSIITVGSHTGRCGDLLLTIRSKVPVTPDRPLGSIYPRMFNSLEETNYTDERGRWLIAYTQDNQQEAKNVLEQMIIHWTDLTIQHPAFPDPPRLLTRGASNPAQAYIDAHQSRGPPTHISENPNKYNKYNNARKQRFPVSIVIDTTDASVRPRSWASVAKAPGGTNANRPKIPGTTVSPRMSPTNSVASAATTMVTNRTDWESVVTQMRRDHEISLQEYRSETDTKITTVATTFQQMLNDSMAARDARYEQQLEATHAEIAGLGVYIKELVTQLHSLRLLQQRTPAQQHPEEELQLNPLSDDELMLLAPMSGSKRDAASRTPLRSQLIRAKGRPQGTPPSRLTHPEIFEEGISPQNLFPVRTEPTEDGAGTEDL